MPDSASSWLLRCGAALGVGAVLFTCLLYYSPTLEDSFITFRYSEHLAAGDGLGAWNTNGEFVEGYTSFLWMLMLAGIRLLGCSIEHASKVMGIACYAALCLLFLVFPLMRSRANQLALGPGNAERAVLIAGVLMSSCLPLAWYAASGMETSAFSLLVGFALLGPLLWQKYRYSVVLAVLLVLMRPEGIVVVAMSCLFHAIAGINEGRGARREVAVLATGAVTQLLLLLFRIWTFGSFWPNTYYAKARGADGVHWQFGFDYVSGYGSAHLASVVVVLLALTVVVVRFRNSTRELRLMLPSCSLFCFYCLYCVYILKVGGDNLYAFPFYRHFLHVLPVLALLTGVALVTISERWVQGGLLLIIVSAGVTGSLRWHDGALLKASERGLESFPSFALAPVRPFYKWIRSYTDSQTVVASALAGELPYYVDAVHIDVLGLNNEHIAHHGDFDPEGPVDSKSEMDYVLRRRPDILEGYVSATQILRGESRERIVRGRRAMVESMLANPTFQVEYDFVQNGPYADWDRAIFMRRGFCEQFVDLQCTPVLQTSLYGAGPQHGM